MSHARAFAAVALSVVLLFGSAVLQAYGAYPIDFDSVGTLTQKRGYICIYSFWGAGGWECHYLDSILGATGTFQIKWDATGHLPAARECPGCTFDHWESTNTEYCSIGDAGSQETTVTFKQGEVGCVVTAYYVDPPPTIFLAPNCGGPGTIITLSGYGFIPNVVGCTVESDPLGLIETSSCIVDSGTGVVSGVIYVADGASGKYTVTVEGVGPGFEATANYNTNCPAVGGCVQPVNKLAVLAPWLAVIGLVGCSATVVMVARKRRL